MASPMVAPNSSDLRWWSEETVAVVTGGNRGIGLEIVKQLSERGLTVVLTARDGAKGPALADSLGARRRLRVEFHQLDVTDAESVRRLAAWVSRRFGGLDVLVNNAGVSFNDVHSNSVDQAEMVINTNFYGPKLLIEALLPLFRRSPTTSRILNISSRLGSLKKLQSPSLKALFEDPDGQLTETAIDQAVAQFLDGAKAGTWKEQGWPVVWPDYSVSKLALNAYSRLLARDHQQRGLSVNCYCPGFTRTGMTGGRGSRTPEEAARVAVELALLPPGELLTGKFFRWSTPPFAFSKL